MTKAKKSVRALRVKRVKLDELIPDQANARLHRERNLDSIKISLTRFGQQKPIVIDEKNVIVAGNGTYEAAKSLGWLDLNVVQTKLSESERVAFGIADNRTAELAEWDFDVLGRVLASMKDETAQLAAGFTRDEVNRIVKDLTPEFEATDSDNVPRLDLQNSIKCPECGHEFDRPSGMGRWRTDELKEKRAADGGK